MLALLQASSLTRACHAAGPNTKTSMSFPRQKDLCLWNTSYTQGKTCIRSSILEANSKSKGAPEKTERT